MDGSDMAEGATTSRVGGISGRERRRRDEQIEAHLPLVKWVASRMLVDASGEFDREDLVGFGTVGLIQAVDRFDSSQGVAFRTYAVSRIRGAIIDALRQSDRLPRSVRQKAKKYAAVQSHLSADGAHPSHAELAAAMGMTRKEYDEMRVHCSWQTISLDEILDRPNVDGVGEVPFEVPGENDNGGFSERLEYEETVQALSQAVASLPPRELTLVSLYYKDGMSMKEISEILGVSESRICQLHQRALALLRRRLEPERAVG